MYLTFKEGGVLLEDHLFPNWVVRLGEKILWVMCVMGFQVGTFWCCALFFNNGFGYFGSYNLSISLNLANLGYSDNRCAGPRGLKNRKKERKYKRQIDGQFNGRELWRDEKEIRETKTCGVGYNYKEVVWFSFDYGWKRRPTETTGLWVWGKFWFWGFPCSKFLCVYVSFYELKKEKQIKKEKKLVFQRDSGFFGVWEARFYRLFFVTWHACFFYSLHR